MLQAMSRALSLLAVGIKTVHTTHGKLSNLPLMLKHIPWYVTCPKLRLVEGTCIVRKRDLIAVGWSPCCIVAMVARWPARYMDLGVETSPLVTDQYRDIDPRR